MARGAVVGVGTVIGLVVIGWKVARDCRGEEPPVDPEAKVVLAPWSAHGLTASLPSRYEASGNYANGVIRADDPGGPTVRLEWDLGPALSEAALEAEASEAPAIGIGTATVDVTLDGWVDVRAPGDGPSRTRAYHSELGSGAVTAWRCGRRNLRLTTVGLRSERNELHRRVLAGVSCAPDAAAEADRLPVAVPERAELGLVSHDADRMLLRGPGRSTFSVERLRAAVPDDGSLSAYAIPSLLGPLAPPEAVVKTYGSSERPRFAWAYPDPERAAHGFAVLPCPVPPGGALLIDYAPAGERVTAAELELLGAFRCAGSKEPPSVVRPWAVVADEACKRGDTATCEAKDLDLFPARPGGPADARP